MRKNILVVTVALLLLPAAAAPGAESPAAPGAPPGRAAAETSLKQARRAEEENTTRIKPILGRGALPGPQLEALTKKLSEASVHLAEGEASLGSGKFAEAVESAEKARQCQIEAWCLAQTSAPGEHRAFWCNTTGRQSLTWDEAIKRLADNGFTAILPLMLWAGTAYYESRVLPVAPEVKEKGDQLAQCVAACRKYGLQCHAWKTNWYLGSRASTEFVARMKKEGRLQVRFDGVVNEQWLCPSQPENQRLDIDSMVEVATNYDVDGIHFDYIRYPNRDGCFCPRCREAFEKVLGSAVKNWPADVRKNPALEAKWNDFRRENITRGVAAVSETVRKTRPKVKISAAVFRVWPVDRDNVGQDWKLWCDRGYLDFICPMDYTSSLATFEDLVDKQKQWAGRVPCYPGIGVSTKNWPKPPDTVKLIDFINATRRHKTGGFTVFQYGEAEARDVVPLLGAGITRKPPAPASPDGKN